MHSLLSYLFCFAIAASSFSRIKIVQTNLDDDPDSIKEEFKHFLGNVLSNLADRRDQEELSIVNNRHVEMAYWLMYSFKVSFHLARKGDLVFYQ